MMDILKKTGGAVSPESSEEIINLDPSPELVDAAADDIIGATSKTGGDDEADDYVESILDTFAPYVGAEFDSDADVDDVEPIEGADDESSEGMVMADPDDSSECMVEGGVEDMLDSVDSANLVTIGDSDESEEKLIELGESEEEPDEQSEEVEGADEHSEEVEEPEDQSEEVEGAELEDSSDEFNVDQDNIDSSALADINELMSQYNDVQ